MSLLDSAHSALQVATERLELARSIAAGALPAASIDACVFAIKAAAKVVELQRVVDIAQRAVGQAEREDAEARETERVEGERRSAPALSDQERGALGDLLASVPLNKTKGYNVALAPVGIDDLTFRAATEQTLRDPLTGRFQRRAAAGEIAAKIRDATKVLESRARMGEERT